MRVFLFIIYLILACIMWAIYSSVKLLIIRVRYGKKSYKFISAYHRFKYELKHFE